MKSTKATSNVDAREGTNSGLPFALGTAADSPTMEPKAMRTCQSAKTKKTPQVTTPTTVFMPSNV